MRWFSSSSSRKFRKSGSAPSTALCSPSFFSLRREVRREEEHLQLAVCRRARRRTRRAARARRRACPRRARPRTASVRRRRRSPPSPASAPRPDSAAKSSSATASSTSRRWSSAVSVLRVTFSVARIVRSATSARISWIARRVSGLDVLARLLEQLLAALLAGGDRVGLLLLAGLARAGDDLVGLRGARRSAARGTRPAARRPPCASARPCRSTPRSPAGAGRAPPRCAGTRPSRGSASTRRTGTASRPSARCSG